MIRVSSIFIAQHVSIDPLDRAPTFIRCNQTFGFMQFPGSIQFFACVIVSRMDHKDPDGQLQLEVVRPDKSIALRGPVPYGFSQGSLNSTFFGNMKFDVNGPGIHFLVVTDGKKAELARFPLEVGVVQRVEVPPVRKGEEN